jgi:hypothetical protein
LRLQPEIKNVAKTASIADLISYHPTQKSLAKPYENPDSWPVFPSRRSHAGRLRQRQKPTTARPKDRRRYEGDQFR